MNKLKLRLKFLCVHIALVLFIISTILNPYCDAFAEDASTASLVLDTELIQGSEDKFGKEFEFGLEDQMALKFKITYDKSSAKYQLKNGDKLSLQLIPKDTTTSYLRVNTVDFNFTKLIDAAKNIDVADLNVQSNGLEFMFNYDVSAFDAKVSLPFKLSSSSVLDYFNKNKGKDKLIVEYTLHINNKEQTGKSIKLVINRPKKPNINTKFSKTRGVFLPDAGGNPAEGEFLYNINIGTKLSSPNEFVIYDTPDVGLGFDGDISVYANDNGQIDKHPILDDSTSAETANGIKLQVYDVYFLTEEAKANNLNREAAYEEKTLIFKRADVPGGSINSMSTVSVPKNILFEKPMGQKLSESELKQINAKGGLYKTVGKGFKLCIQNFKVDGVESGGFLKLVYNLKVKSASNNINSNGNPIYRNSASFYAQQIPTCDPIKDKDCVPIKYEKKPKGRFWIAR